MAATWTAGTDRSTSDIITRAQWNALLGANGSLNFVNSALSSQTGYMLKWVKDVQATPTTNQWYTAISAQTAGYLLTICGSRSGLGGTNTAWTGEKVEFAVSIDGGAFQYLSGKSVGPDTTALDDVQCGYDPDGNKAYAARRIDVRTRFTSELVVHHRHTRTGSFPQKFQVIYIEDKAD